MRLKSAISLLALLLGATQAFAAPRKDASAGVTYYAKANARFGGATSTFDLFADPGPGGPTTKAILYGGSAILWPDFLDGDGVIDNGVGAVTSGNSSTVNPLVDTTYTLTVTNAAGDSVTSTVTINVAIVTMTPVAPTTKTVSCTKTFTFGGAVVSGAVNPAITWSVDGTEGGNASTGTINGSGLYTAPVTPGTHTIRATSVANPSVYQEAVVTVVDLPTIDTLVAATPSAIQYGGTSVISATYSHGDGVLTDGTTPNALVSPISWTTPALFADTTYTLTVTNAAGDTAVGSVTVTVSNVTMTALSPATKTLSLTKTQQFTGGVVSGAVDPTVIWSVVQGAGFGSIDGTGLYSAPAVMPGSPTVTIRCTSNAKGTILQEATITLVKLPTIQSFTVE